MYLIIRRRSLAPGPVRRHYGPPAPRDVGSGPLRSHSLPTVSRPGSSPTTCRSSAARRAGRPLGAIRQRLGWLDAPRRHGSRASPDLAAFAARAAGTSMIRRSTCWAWAAAACAPRSCATCGAAQPHGADAHGARHDRRAHDSAGRPTTLDRRAARCFVVASKSGGDDRSRRRSSATSGLGRRRASGDDAGRHFVAITDPGTSLVALARERGYRHTFINPPDIGGRYSALSLFGLVPAALLGVDIARAARVRPRRMATRAARMATAIPASRSARSWPTHASAGRDKLTLLLAAGAGSRSARGSNSWSPRAPARTAAASCRSSASRIGSRQRVRRRSRVRRGAHADARGRSTQRGARLRSGAAIRCFAIETAADGAGRGVLPLGVRDGGRRRRARRQSVRRAERAGREDADAGAARCPSARRGAFRLDPPFDARRRATRAASSPAATARRHAGPAYVAILDYLPADPRRADVIVDACAPRSASGTQPGHDLRRRPALSALDRSVPQGRARTPGCSCCSPPSTTRRRRCRAPTTRSAR